MPRARKGPSGPRFEEALGRLESIVKELEEGDRPLEESLRLFEEGVRLTRLCAARLDEAQARIDLMARGADGQIALAPFEPPDEEEDEPGRDPDGEDER